MHRPWDDGSESVANACKRAQVAFEFFEKLDVPLLCCFHDRDIAPEGATLAETNFELGRRCQSAQRAAAAHGREVAVGHRQHVQQPTLMPVPPPLATSKSFAYAAAQVKKALEVTKELGGENYVFWVAAKVPKSFQHRHEREMDHLARFFPHGGRLCQRDWIHWPILDRAQAKGANQASIRFDPLRA